MKKTIVLLGVALATFMIVGCNNSNSTQIDGEPLLVREDVLTECDEKFEFKVTGGEDTNVSIEYKDTENTHFNVFGVDIVYDIVTPCKAGGNCEIYIESDEGVCPDGYEVSSSGSHCWLISATCGAGTVYDNATNTCEAECATLTCGTNTYLDVETNTCVANDCEAGLPVEPQPPIPVCPEGTTLVGDNCVPNAYIPAYVPPDGFLDCVKGYTWDADQEVCNLDAAAVKPV